MSDVFISYSHSDRQKAKVIAEAIEQQGYTVWWDPKIPPGKTFAAVIEEAVAEAKCVVVLWSEESVKSEWVQTEAAEAKQRKILVPALIEDVVIPLEFRRIQAADLRAWQKHESHADFLIMLDAIADNVGRPPVSRPDQEVSQESSQPKVELPPTELPPTKTEIIESVSYEYRPKEPKSSALSKIIRFPIIAVLVGIGLFFIAELMLFILHKPAPPEPEYYYETDAISLDIKANPELNLYEGAPQPLKLCIYQLKDPNVFNQMCDSVDGLNRLLKCIIFDQSVVSSKHSIIQPGQKITLSLDRAEDAKYVALVAGYSNLEKDGMTRLFKVPLVPKEKDLLGRTKIYKPGSFFLNLDFEPRAIGDTKDTAKSLYRVSIEGRPTEANPDAKVMPHSTELTLECSEETQSLMNLNYPVRKTFDWSQEDCGDVIFIIMIGNIVLNKRYKGALGFPEFLRDFGEGTRVFYPNEFPENRSDLRLMKIKYIKVKYRFTGHNKILKDFK